MERFGISIARTAVGTGNTRAHPSLTVGAVALGYRIAPLSATLLGPHANVEMGGDKLALATSALGEGEPAHCGSRSAPGARCAARARSSCCRACSTLPG